MSGVDQLIEAAQFLEQQERINLSPQNGATSAIFHISPTHPTRTSTLNLSQDNSNNLTSTNRLHNPQHHHQLQPQQCGKIVLGRTSGISLLSDSNTTGSGIGNGINDLGLSITSNGQLTTSSASSSSSSSSSPTTATKTTIINTGTSLQHKQLDFEFTNSIATNSNVTSNGSNNSVTIITARGTSTNGRTSDSRTSEDEDSSEISVCGSPTRITTPSISKSNALSTSPATFIVFPSKNIATATTTLPLSATNNNGVVSDNANALQLQHHYQQQAQPQQNEHEQSAKLQYEHEQQQPLQSLLKTRANHESLSPSVASLSNSSSVASKQMLLNNGVRIASSALYTAAIPANSSTTGSTVTTTSATSMPITSIINGGSSTALESKTIQIPHNSKVFAAAVAHSYPSNLASNQQSTAVTATVFSHTNNNLINKTNQTSSNGSNSSFNGSGSKTLLTLTPPPMPNRNFVEPSTPSRTRSYSLSHKLTANQLSLHNIGNSSTSTGTATIVDDIHQLNSYAGNSRSPPRGSNYSHIFQQQQQQLGAGSHTASSLSNLASGSATSSRRRTISSNSNGAGNREVHNKLEKNRRAHLKECYDQLKQNLPIKDEDRKKISNLSILGEAHKTVLQLQMEEKRVEADHEEQAKKKIILQKRLNNLKRSLAHKLEQVCPTLLNDAEMASCSTSATNTAIPCEKEAGSNETSSLSSGRGSMLYSSSSSLSSGGSNTMSSPVGAGVQTAMPTAISPVICKTINSTHSPTSPKANNSSSNNIINNNTVHINSNINSGNTVLQQIKSINISANTSPAGSPNALISINSSSSNTNKSNSSISISKSKINNNSIIINNNNSTVNNNNNNTAPLSLTAKNITATSGTRGSPTPSTPSPTSSSSSSISSGSSMISSSPPIINNGGITVGLGVGVNGSSLITGRNTVTVNIPNGLRFANVAGATIGNGTATAAATIIATTAPGNGAPSNAIMLQALRGCHLV